MLRHASLERGSSDVLAPPLELRSQSVTTSGLLTALDLVVG